MVVSRRRFEAVGWPAFTANDTPAQALVQLLEQSDAVVGNDSLDYDRSCHALSLIP